MTFGQLRLRVLFLVGRGWENLAGVSPATLGVVVLLGVASTGLAYGLYFYALASAESALAAALQYLEPLVTMARAAWLLRERWAAGMLAGGALILLGVWLVDRAGRGPAASQSKVPWPRSTSTLTLSLTGPHVPEAERRGFRDGWGSLPMQGLRSPERSPADGGGRSHSVEPTSPNGHGGEGDG
jgi:uncharacterized membrane protein